MTPQPNPPPTPESPPPTGPKPRILKLRSDQERRRFFAGVSVDQRANRVCAALVAAGGRGLEVRLELASHVLQPLPNGVTAIGAECDCKSRGSAPFSQVAAKATEAAAVALERLGAIEHEVWPLTFLCGAADSGGCLDATLLAEMSQLNVVDDFAARDVVVNGTGEHLDALPLWLLLRHTKQQRLVVQADTDFRLLQLPPSRDERGSEQILVHRASGAADLHQYLTQQLHRSSSSPGELLWLADGLNDRALLDELQEQHPALTVQTPGTLGIAIPALPAACAAVGAMLHIDQVPANLPLLTGATAPRVLGCLTPGSAKSWNRLLRDLAFSRPLVTALRAAV